MRLAQGAVSWLLIGLICTMFFFIISLFTGGLVRYLVFILFLLSLFIDGFFFVFFRDPQRTIGGGVVAVADGVIRDVSEVSDEDVGASVCVSTFMNIHHVHVNRMPLDGMIQRMNHIPGAHIPAFQKESLRNERMISLIDTEYGPIKIIQIAGTLARRIVNYHSPGKQLKKGQRYGIIRLGSRVDLLIPKNHIKKILIQKGDHVRAGESQILSML
jgi:phosphatidylserine decarboxylase